MSTLTSKLAAVAAIGAAALGGGAIANAAGSGSSGSSASSSPSAPSYGTPPQGGTVGGRHSVGGQTEKPLTGSVAAAIAGIITSVAQMAIFFSWFGGGDDEDRPNPIVLILMSLLAPLAAAVIQMAISRTREYDADEDGARLTGDPLALASALRKLELGTAARPLVKTPRLEPVSSMMIANPFGVKTLFSTHPPMDKRIERLQALAESDPRFARL